MVPSPDSAVNWCACPSQSLQGFRLSVDWMGTGIVINETHPRGQHLSHFVFFWFLRDVFFGLTVTGRIDFFHFVIENKRWGSPFHTWKPKSWLFSVIEPFWIFLLVGVGTTPPHGLTLRFWGVMGNLSFIFSVTVDLRILITSSQKKLISHLFDVFP